MKTVLVLEHPSVPRKKCPWAAGRDVWYQDVVPGQPAECPAVMVDSEHPLFLLYTSGSTGKPKGVVHCTGARPGCLAHKRLLVSVLCAAGAVTHGPPVHTTWYVSQRNINTTVGMPVV